MGYGTVPLPYKNGHFALECPLWSPVSGNPASNGGYNLDDSAHKRVLKRMSHYLSSMYYGKHAANVVNQGPLDLKTSMIGRHGTGKQEMATIITCKAGSIKFDIDIVHRAFSSNGLSAISNLPDQMKKSSAQAMTSDSKGG